MSGTLIKIEPAAPGEHDRHVVITGSQEGCQSACYLINARLQEEVARRAQQPTAAL